MVVAVLTVRICRDCQRDGPFDNPFRVVKRTVPLAIYSVLPVCLFAYMILSARRRTSLAV